MPYTLPENTLEFSEGEFVAANLPLSPEEWMQCCVRDEEFYMGGCCGAMSAAQDLLNELFRFCAAGIWEKHHLDTLGEWYDLMRGHDGYSEAHLPDLSERAGSDPLARLMMVYEAYKPHKKSSKLDGPVHRPDDDVQAIRDALRTIGRVAPLIDYGMLFGDTSCATKAARTQGVLTLIPALRVLNDRLIELAEEFEGYALLDDDGEIRQSMRGPAIFADREEAEEVKTTWEAINGAHSRIVKARVTVKDGIVLED